MAAKICGFLTKEAAVAEAKRLIARKPKRNLDISCLQRSLTYHPPAPGMPVADLLNPALNVTWAAEHRRLLFTGGPSPDRAGAYQPSAGRDGLRAATRYHRWVQDDRYWAYQITFLTNLEQVRRERGIATAASKRVQIADIDIGAARANALARRNAGRVMVAEVNR
ncbi:hypothetical protein [Azospirillum soli]|uniref:hypothetical protein n=1 Tax=Azospirillum soli TaxID=1304799 RepID=UPI001AE95F1E|nr:hypothetical protein [Azospirillum soli]MBP2315491.1 hypothetical protein [Azospirillum soli]